jgi:hypothetical protein
MAMRNFATGDVALYGLKANSACTCIWANMYQM